MEGSQSCQYSAVWREWGHDTASKRAGAEWRANVDGGGLGGGGAALDCGTRAERADDRRAGTPAGRDEGEFLLAFWRAHGTFEGGATTMGAEVDGGDDCGATRDRRSAAATTNDARCVVASTAREVVVCRAGAGGGEQGSARGVESSCIDADCESRVLLRGDGNVESGGEDGGGAGVCGVSRVGAIGERGSECVAGRLGGVCG